MGAGWTAIRDVSISPHGILGGAATCSEGFVICFLKVSLACLGSMAAAVQPTARGTLCLRKQFTKPTEQVAAPPSIVAHVPMPILLKVNEK